MATPPAFVFKIRGSCPRDRRGTIGGPIKGDNLSRSETRKRKAAAIGLWVRRLLAPVFLAVLLVLGPPPAVAKYASLVMDAETKEIVEDTLMDVKFSGLSWKGNEGFYYSSYDKPKGSELSAKTDQHKLYYHTLGTSQKEDQLVFGGTAAEKHRYVSGYVTEDDKYLVVSASISTSGNKLFIKDLDADT